MITSSVHLYCTVITGSVHLFYIVITSDVCRAAVFLDYYLTTLHPLLILMLCVILYSRKLPPKMTPPSPAPIINTR